MSNHSHSNDEERWAQFSNFKRQVINDNQTLSLRKEKEKMTVMKSDGKVKDVLPGEYHYDSLFPLNDLHATPKYTEATEVKWISNKVTGKGSLKFPNEFNETIKIEIGTSEFLSYYGVTITNNRPNDTITLGMRHAIQDFNYSKDYLQEYILSKKGNGGAGLERHAFSHVDCPMDSDNGIFVLAKFVDEEESILHLTGFRIPLNHCILIPGYVIHINDYLKGTWRTMLSDAAPIDYVFLEKEDKRFHFKFEDVSKI